MSCLFCDIAEGRKPAKVVRQGPDWVAFHDIHPQAPTHVLLVPKKHIATANDLAPEDEALVGRIVAAARDIARELGIADKGYRIVLNTNRGAGQSVFHLHFHLLGGRGMTWPPG